MSLDIHPAISWTNITSLIFAIGLGAFIMGWLTRKNHFDVAGKVRYPILRTPVALIADDP